MLRKVVSAMVVSIVGLALALPAQAVTQSADGDDQVTGAPTTYYRYDGGTDAALNHCNDASSNPAEAAPTASDTDPNDGGHLRQQNEPMTAIDPTDTSTVITGWNDYCGTDLDLGLMGLGYSRNGGESWKASLLPGYPQDTSAKGLQSPIHKEKLSDYSDPIGAFDNDGNLFFGGIAYAGDSSPQGGHNMVFVAKYNTSPPACAATTCPGMPVSYDHTSVVGTGASSKNLFGAFHDKPMLEVDRTGGSTDGNVYVCWTKFNGNSSPSDIKFSRSTDHGTTFSKPITVSSTPFSPSVQGCDIAIQGDGTISMVWRTINTNSSKSSTGIGYSESHDAGKTWSPTKTAVALGPNGLFLPFDGARDCGDGTSECPAHYVFNRYPLEPRVTADQSGELPGVFITYFAVDPTTLQASATSYQSAGGGMVGQSKIYVARKLPNGSTWDISQVEPGQATGQQFLSDADALDGTLVVMWQDSRADPSAANFQLPPGNDASAMSTGDEVHNSYYSTSADGAIFTEPVQVSDEGNSSDYEMFANRQVPFYGDYNWVSLAADGDGLFAYMAWTDNRDVVAGPDPRETTQDGFDVHQCRVLNADAVTYSADRCANAGGLDQNIYGNSANL
ncbi:MAG: hypothetical protein QOH90_2065 [Actinomycetota bacterium]|jgi:hypothetical protein|nr:hypothetical protein [Actinomycetota bacterium]